MRSRDERFAAAWDASVEDAVDAIEARARQLALQGDARLLMFFLQHLRPEVYGDRIKIDVESEARRIAKELGGTDEEIEQGVVEARAILKKRREEWRRRV